jgi:hypothetical protein
LPHTLETEVPGPRPKLHGFSKSGLAICCNTPNKERNNKEGQRKEIYYAAQAHCGEKAK